MDTLHAMLNAYLGNSLTTDEFADQFIEHWNDIRVEQNKAIDDSGMREKLDVLWKQYKAGDMDEVAYGMRWTDTLSKLKNVRILPQSIVFTIGNEIYNHLTLYKESEQLDTQEIPTDEALREQVKQLLDLVAG
jgi:hypothetical protein